MLLHACSSDTKVFLMTLSLTLCDSTVNQNRHVDIDKNSPLRGRTLGFLGPTNPLRMALFHFLVHPFIISSLLHWQIPD
jgi:hypothetical protein